MYANEDNRDSVIELLDQSKKLKTREIEHRGGFVRSVYSGSASVELHDKGASSSLDQTDIIRFYKAGLLAHEQILDDKLNSWFENLTKKADPKSTIPLYPNLVGEDD